MAEVNLILKEQVKDKTIALNLAIEIIAIGKVGEEAFLLWVSLLQGEKIK